MIGGTGLVDSFNVSLSASFIGKKESTFYAGCLQYPQSSSTLQPFERMLPTHRALTFVKPVKPKSI